MRRPGALGAERLLGALVDLLVDLLAHRLQERLVGRADARQERGEVGDRVAALFSFPFRRRPVQPLVVRQRMRVRPDGVRVHQRRSAVA